MAIRAILNVSGLQLEKRVSSYYVVLKIEGVEVEQMLFYDNGEFYIPLNEVRPSLPGVLNQHVRCVTSKEEFRFINSQSNLAKVKHGAYRSHSGDARAQVLVSNNPSSLTTNMMLTMTADSIRAHQAFRRHLLFGQTQTLSEAAAA